MMSRKKIPPSLQRVPVKEKVQEVKKMKKVVVIASGGLDSTTILATLLNSEEGEYEVYPMNFNYGQRHSIEQSRFADICLWFDGHETSGKLMKAEVVTLPTIQCLLTNENFEVPEGDMYREGVAPTYVPGRNTIFIAHALSYAEMIGAEAVYIGVNALDYSGYPDCRPEYLAEWNEMAKLCNVRGIEGNPIKIIAPLIDKTKAEIIIMGKHFGTPYHLTWSCYKGEGKPCGVCDSCKLRAKGFEDAGEVDPAL